MPAWREFRRSIALSLIGLGLLSGGNLGCSFFRSLTGFSRPALAFKTLSISDASLSGATLNLVYVVSNPNPIPLLLKEVDYRLSVEGKQVVAGRPPKGLQVPAQGHAEVVLPASVKFADLAPVVQTFLSKDSAHYRAEGNLGLESPVGIVRLPVAREGQFEIPKIPLMELGEPRIGELSLSGATLEIPLSVTNRNSFPLPVAELAGALRIAGSDVGTVATDGLGVLNPRGTQKISLPLTIQFRKAGAAAMALRSGSGEVSFSGSLRSGQIAVPIEWKGLREFHR